MHQYTLLIEGWRFLPHSFAIVNQFQCLELLKRPNVRLIHRDLPYFNTRWLPVRGLFDPQAESAIAAIPPPASDHKPDAIFRIGYPFNLAPAQVPRLTVFVTAEAGFVPQQRVEGCQSLAEAFATSDNLVVITPSNWSRQGILSSGGDPDRVIVIPHGIDPAIFYPESEEQRSRLREQAGYEGFVFLAIGAMSVNKGVETLLKAFAAVATRHPRTMLVMKGADSLYDSKSHLLRAAQSLSEAEMNLIQPRLRYTGESLSFAQVASMYHAADAYVSPSMAEAFNIPVLEAAACGLPVIVTAGGSTDEFTTDEFALRIDASDVEVRTAAEHQRGRALQPNVDSLIHQMLLVIERPQIRQQALEKAPSFVRRNYTWSHVVDRMLRVLLPAES